MAKTSEPETHTLIELKLSKLVIDDSLAGRSQHDIKENAKALKPLIEAAGGWRPDQPGIVFERDGKYHLVAGFTRTAACNAAGIPTGWFSVVADDPAANRTACIRTNQGKPVSRFEQGRIYAAMRDGDDPTKVAKGTPIMAPMKTQEIAESIGLSKQHVDGCIGIYEEPAEIGELINADKINGSVAIRARQLIKDPKKRFLMLKAAIGAAEKEGKTCASEKHLNAVKDMFVELRADTGKKTEAKKEAAKVPALPGADKSEDANLDDDKPKSAPSPKPQSTLDLGSTAPKAESKTATEARKVTFVTILNQWGEDNTIVFDDANIDDLWERFEASNAPL